MNENVKVKVFRFEVSNASSKICSGDDSSSWYYKERMKLSNEYSIENAINEFLEDKILINIVINTVDVHYHNNGRGNIIHLVYTVIYKELN